MRQCVLRCNHCNIHIARVRVLKWKCMLTMYSKNMWLYGNEIHGSYQVNYSQCQRTTAVSSWPHPWHVLVNLHIKAFVSAMSLPRACFLFLLRCCFPNFVLFLNVLVFPFFFFSDVYYWFRLDGWPFDTTPDFPHSSKLLLNVLINATYTEST